MNTETLIPCQREAFDIPEDIAYFNCAYMSPLSRAVLEAGLDGVRRKSQPWKLSPEDFFSESDRARTLFAQLVGAESNDIAIIPSASYGLGVAAANLSVPAGKHILVLEEQFPSNVYPWYECARRQQGDVMVVPRPADGDWTGAVLERIDSDVALAALPQVHWSDGGALDLERIGKALRDADARLVLDLTQSLGAMPLDLAVVRPDFLVAAAYKWLLGPYSMGFMYVAPPHQGGVPLEYNWMNRANANDFTSLAQYAEDFAPGARRFDVGEKSNFALMPMAVAALEQVLSWRVAAIQATLAAITSRIAAAAEELGLQPAPQATRSGHILGVRVPGGIPEGMVAGLREAGVFVSQRGDALRIAPHVYNSEADEARLIDALRKGLGRR